MGVMVPYGLKLSKKDGIVYMVPKILVWSQNDPLSGNECALQTTNEQRTFQS